MGNYTARPTVYRGIKMRSRLEADFARFLDSPRAEAEGWQYEPQCFAGPNGQYLPDFRLSSGSYIEVKPATISRPNAELAIRKMEIVWESEPGACLVMIRWVYGLAFPEAGAIAFGNDRRWTAFVGDDERLWPGDLGELRQPEVP